MEGDVGGRDLMDEHAEELANILDIAHDVIAFELAQLVFHPSLSEPSSNQCKLGVGYFPGGEATGLMSSSNKIRLGQFVCRLSVVCPMSIPRSCIHEFGTD